MLPQTSNTNEIAVRFELQVSSKSAAQQIHPIDTTAGSTLTDIDPAAQ